MKRLAGSAMKNSWQIFKAKVFIYPLDANLSVNIFFNRITHLKLRSMKCWHFQKVGE